MLFVNLCWLPAGPVKVTKEIYRFLGGFAMGGGVNGKKGRMQAFLQGFVGKVRIGLT
jgi:hypothetical protein